MLNCDYLTSYYRFSFPLIFTQPIFLDSDEQISIKQAIDIIEHIWSYAGKAIILTRHSLNISLKICSRVTLGGRGLDARVLKVVTRLKLFSIVSVPLSMISAKNVLEKISKSYLLEDKEGIALAALSLSVITIDILDSLATFINTVAFLMAKTNINALSRMGMPLAFGMVGLGSISRIIQLVKTYLVFKEFQHHFALQNENLQELDTEDLYCFFKEKLDLSDSEINMVDSFLNFEELDEDEIEILKQEEIKKIKEKKKWILTRTTSIEIINEIQKIYDLIETSSSLTLQQIQEITSRLSRLEFLFEKKMSVDMGYLIANFLNLIGLSLFYLSFSSVLPLSFLASSLVLRLSLVGYQDFTHPPAICEAE